jgi:hypothetical protein
MRLRRIEVRNFRKLRHAVVEDLSDGLNVVVGDNEAGKSTLLSALRAALFEKHRVSGETAQGMLPFGAQVRPEVEVEFDIDGRPWALRKAFVQRPEAELAGPGERLQGDAVEERLAELFGFHHPGRGGSKPEEHQGAHGLLWVEQGAAHRSLGVGAGRDRLAAALESEVGQVLGGERGRQVLSAADRRRSEYWTPTGRPKGSWKKLADEIEELEAECTRLEDQFRSYDAKVVALGHRQEEIARHEREDRVGQAQVELVAAKAAMVELEALNQRVREAEERRRRAVAERDFAQQRYEARVALVTAETMAVVDLERARADATYAARFRLKREEEARAADEKLCRVRSARTVAEARVAAIEDALVRRRVAEEIAQLEARLAACAEAQGQSRAARAVAAAIPVTAEAVARLDCLQTDLDRATAELRAASVVLSFSPEGGGEVTFDGRLHDPSQPLALTSDAIVMLSGWGTLQVRPGGGTADLSRAVESASRSLEDALKTFGVVDVPTARTALQRRSTALQEAEGHDRILAALTPQGVERLAQDLADRRARLDVASPASAPASGDDVSDAHLRHAKAALAEVIEALDGAEMHRQAAERDRAGADVEAARAAERAAAAERSVGAHSQALLVARNDALDDVLGQAVAVAENALEAEMQSDAAARAALQAAEPERTRLRVQKAERAEAAIRDDLDRLRREKRDLEVELGTLGRAGVGEFLAEAEGKLTFLRGRLARADGEAAAAKLLHDALEGAQRESKDRWLGPVRARVAPYLRLLHPGSDVVLNEETLELEGMVREGRSEPFSSLSMGAREQVAVITRLALAEILLEAGHPAAVILDDALVNTDEGRLEAMHIALHRAAERMQVLVLTCRERDFLDLGAPIHRLR